MYFDSKFHKMLPRQHKQIPTAADIIDIDSSDDESGSGVGGGRGGGVYAGLNADIAKLSNVVKLQTNERFNNQSPPVINSSASEANYRHLDSRSFWKAGDYEVGPTKFTSAQGDLEHARVHPKFLHSNATSHKWAFGAIAELLDNTVDEIGNGATFVKVDRTYNTKDNSPALLFQDDGGGMDPESMRKCMSLGYSSKTSNTTIGQYGNGFKTSTMRLGADVIVFSRASRSSQATQSVGLLSYTFLRRTRQDDVIVPMIDFDISDNWAQPMFYSSKEDWSMNLRTILEWSPFATEDDLMLQFDSIGSHGTKIIIFNLWMNDEGIYELCFDDDDEDIRLRDEANQGTMSKTYKRVLELQSHISYRMRYSLRAYASILYLKKFINFKIILRGKPVEQYIIADDLKHSKVVTYRPISGVTSKEVIVATTIGFIKEAPGLGVCGFNVYHKNRLIRPYWKVTADGSSKGHGVVGVLEANFIEPAHDKQDFERSSLFLKLESRLKQMVVDFWKAHCHLIGHPPDGTQRSDFKKQSDTQHHVEVADTDLHSTGFGANLQRSSTGSVLETHMDTSLDQICEENIQLVTRCEEHIQKEAELKRTIGELENELEEIRNKCARLSAHLGLQRRQILMSSNGS
ncbi:protein MICRORCHIDIA 2-like isoform X1 [Primulina eburnea]|uniref:protein MICRORCHIDIA 2-like isoform X1 n=2 Tax=Primulina eburnea TaxID=1245227 RepID=UPI003C6C3749